MIDGAVLGPSRYRWLGAFIALVFASGVVGAFAKGDAEGSGGRSGRGGGEPEEVAFDCAAWNELGSSAPAPAPPDETPLASDEGLRAGFLENRMRYFVRANERPGGSASLALVVDAGAALEDDDQHGAAHYLEHMLFNGTEAFPGNQLEDVLAGLGADLGPDLNAFTSEDATVYFLHLSNEGADIDQGLDVLLQWATKATIAPEDVGEERGVILEELRSRSGPEDRFFDRVRDLALAGTPYEDHEVIGTVESVEAMTAAQLRRFYEDWYRPELMSVVAVGDFDPAAVEAKVRARFEPLPPSGPDARPRPQLESGLAGEPRFGTYLEGELLGTSAELLFARAAEPAATTDGLRRRLLRDVALTAVDRRLNDDAARGLVPFYDVDVEVFDLVREFDVVTFSVDADPERLGDALEDAIHELARVRRDGLRDDEVARAVADRRARAQADLEAAPSTQDRELLFRYVDHALEGGPTAASDALANAELALLDQITAADVTTELRRITDCRALSAQAGVPPEYADLLPDEDRIVEALDSATADGEVAERQPDPPAPTALMATPAPAAPSNASSDNLFGPARVLTYANGATVVIQPSDIHAGFVTVDGESPGGLAAVADADLANATFAPRLVDGSGVGDLDRVDLDRVLAGSDVGAVTSIEPSAERINASGSAAHLERIFQLLHLRMISSRIDDVAVATLRGETRLLTEDPLRRGDTALADARDELVWQDDARYREQPTAADLQSLDPARALALHRDRFGNVGDFVFTVVGDVDLAVAEDLANRYIGTLPGTDRAEDGSHQPPPPPASAVSRRVEAGGTDQARVNVVYDVEIPVDPIVRDRSQLLASVVDDALRTRIREQLGASYSPTVSVEPDELTGRVRTHVYVETDPARADEVVAEIHGTVNHLRVAGPTDDEVQQVLQPILRDFEFIDLPTISETLMFVVIHGISEVRNAPILAAERLRGAGAGAVRDLADRLLPAGAHVEIVQVPA